QPCATTDYDILYGNISLYQALDYLADGDAQQNVLPLLHTLYSQ
nr:type-F conjugative transfer system pilin assembly protein TrbC [Vibrio vulnificus]